MAITSRDWWMLGIGFGVGFFIFTATGREAVKTGVGVTKSEAERLLKKVQKKAKVRAKV